MLEYPSARAEKPMHADLIRDEAAQMLRDLAGTVLPGTSLKAVWRSLATQLRLTVGQIKRIWYGEWAILPAWVYLTVRAAWDKKSYVATILETDIDARATAFTERRQRVEARRA